ncbi:MAG: SRPBCC family protein [Candidatus Hodarchaeales archaeon]|jgi:hypothetical protein
MKGSATAIIHKPINEIFSFITNVENQDQWVDGSSDTKLSSENDLRKGSIFEGKYTYSGKTHEIQYEVVNFSPPTLFGIKSPKGPFPFESRLDLKDVDGHTEVTNTIDAGSDHILTSMMFFLFKPVLRRQMNKQMKKELNKLKTILESDN